MVKTKYMKTIYIIIWVQCSDATQARAETTTDFKTTSKDQDTFAILKMIKQVTFCCDTIKFSPNALRNAHRSLNTIEQGCMATPNK